MIGPVAAFTGAGQPQPLVGWWIGGAARDEAHVVANRHCQAGESVGPAVGEANQSNTPGPLGSAIPSAVALSPPRSTSVVGWPRPDPRANAEATTVVPLPPFAAQQRIT